ncbi:hypothetical protein ACN2WE_37275 [Streptomyces sp. cg28]|uniref:hypothetical protein n=1 Tax=unclassified Streptomyces TaxID=2593676 RepID=UPI000DBAD8AB|nr:MULTISPECIES: hypothetical protein [unclassified Streptomyces]MYT74895.1 hypothetical protein [Streptomyces sp. SID8367]
MDVAKMELALQRYQDAVAALDAARTDLEAEAAAALRADDAVPEDWARVSELTGWSEQELRRLVTAADTLDLR